MEITNYLTECIDNKTPVSFSKYGDREYNCCTNINNKYDNNYNRDNDRMTLKLKNDLIESFKYIVNETDNGFIGLWYDNYNITFWKSIVNKEINFAKYHTIINFFWKETEQETNNKVKLLKSIKKSKLKKIIVCNELLIKSTILLNIDIMVTVPLNNWFDTKLESMIEFLKKNIKEDEQHIIITCCGMGAKVLIAKLHKLFPNNIYLDFGSAIDEICTKRNTRDYLNHYEGYVEIYKDLIPDNWNDSKYDYIYDIARNDLGTHLPK